MLAKTAPQRGTYVEIVGENLTIVARVVWSNGHRFGVRTNEPIDVSATIRLVRADAPNPMAAPRTGKLAAAAVRSSANASRALGKTLEFATIGAFVATLVIGLALIVYEDLSRPLARAAEQLVGRR